MKTKLTTIWALKSPLHIFQSIQNANRLNQDLKLSHFRIQKLGIFFGFGPTKFINNLFESSPF